ncbi:MAG: gas vesicle protein [Pseudomonadota bacterium]
MTVELQLATAEQTLRSNDDRLVDLVDGLLSHGVVIRGELWLTVADVELVFLGVDLLLATPDKIKPTGAPA